MEFPRGFAEELENQKIKVIRNECNDPKHNLDYHQQKKLKNKKLRWSLFSMQVTIIN